METKETIFENGIGALNALRLFAHNVRLESTEFSSSSEGQGPTLREIIQYRASQSWGDLTRDRDSITIRVIANVGLAPDFVSRTLILRKAEFHASRLFTAPTEEVLAEGGRTFANTFADLFGTHQRNSKLYNFEHGGETFFFVQADDQGATQRLVRDLEEMARGLDVHLKGHAFTLTSHPAFDVPGGVVLIDALEPILTPKDAVLERINQMAAAARELPPTLRMAHMASGDYPMAYTIYPHKFTLQPAEDPSQARTRAFAAAARVSVHQGADEIMGRFITTIHVSADHLPASAGEDEAVSAAVATFNRDWDDAMFGDPRPEILISSATHQTVLEGVAEVEIVIRADTDAARRYNESGRYELRPD